MSYLFLLLVVLLSPSQLFAVAGDINGDSTTNGDDLILLEKHLSGEELLSGDALLAADVNGNGGPDVGDAVTLSRMILGDAVPVPQLLFESQGRAETLITNAGLTLGSVTKLQSDSYPGIVVGQTPKPGSGVPPGSQVNLYIADNTGASITITPAEIDLGTGGTTATFQVDCNGDENLPWYTGSWVTHTASPASGVGDATIQLTIDRSRIPFGSGSIPFFVAPNVSGSTTPAYTYLKYDQQTHPAPLFDYIRSRTPFSPGDTVRMSGTYFAEITEDNQIEINGEVVTALEPVFFPPGLEFQIPETVSPGIASFRVRRVKDQTLGSSPWGPPLQSLLVEPTRIELKPGRDGDHLWVDHPWSILYDSYEGVSVGDQSVGASDWILSASNLDFTDGTFVNAYDGAIVGTFDNSYVLEVLAGDQRWLMPAKRLNSSEVAVLAGFFLDENPEFINVITPGASLTARLWVSEKDTIYPRASNWIPLTVSNSPPAIGSVFEMSAEWLSSGNFPYIEWTEETSIEVAAGTTMFINLGEGRLEAPGIWEGILPFDGRYSSADSLTRRAFLLDTPGTYTVRNLDNGLSRTIEVLDSGAPYFWEYDSKKARMGGSLSGLILPVQWNRKIFINGAEFTVPSGAVPQDSGWLNLFYGSYRILTDTVYVLDDPEQEDSNLRITFSFSRARDSLTERAIDWEPDGLQGPITIEAPYELSQAVNGPPKISALDETSGIYWELPSEADEGNRRVTLTFPAGTYGGTTSSSSDKASGSPVGFPPVRLNTISRSMGIPWIRSSRAVMRDSRNRFAVDYITNPSSSSYATDAYAEGILNTMVDTWDNLEGRQWRTPKNSTTIYLRKSLIFSDYGSTTKAVFGRPSVTINTAQCPINSSEYFTAASHETGHVFQREYTTNVISQWFDEATADWIALDTIGDANFFLDAINGEMPFTNTLPTGFTFGFSIDQAYAASPWPVWLDKKHNGCIKKIYEALDGNPLVWIDHYGAVEDACGESISDLYRDFASDYWMQNFAPVESTDLNGLAHAALGKPVALTMTDTGDMSFSDTRGSFSSVRYSIGQNDACLAKFSGRQAVIRVTFGPDSLLSQVDVYGDRFLPALIPNNPVEIKTVQAPDPDFIVLDNGTTHRTYRFVLANGSRTRSFPVNVRFVYPQIITLSPSSGRYNGGYIVTVSGNGFGNETGSIRISGSSVDIDSWTDSQVRFRMPDVGQYTTTASIVVRTKENVATNALTFTFTQ